MFASTKYEMNKPFSDLSIKLRVNNLMWIFDSLLVLLNVSTYCSVVPYIIFHQYSRVPNILFIIIINVAFLLFRFQKIAKIPSDSLFFIYVCVCLSNVLAVLTNEGWNLLAFSYFILNTSFYLLLYNLYEEYLKSESPLHSLWLAIRGYIWLSFIGVLSAITMFMLIKCGFNPLKTPIVDEYYDLFKANVEVLGASYYYPYYISVIQYFDNLIKIPFFTEYGTICGIFHEPHVITFVVFPALFIICFFEKRNGVRLVYYILWILILLMESSTTNIVAFLISLVVLMTLNKGSRKWLVLFLVLLAYLIYYIGIENTEMFFVLDKLNGEDGSKDYSMGTIEFAFTPKTLFGSNFMVNDYLQANSSAGRRDVGYLSFLFNMIFLALFMIRVVKLVVFSEKFRLFGIAALYFLLHSMKIAMVSYTNPLLILMCFIMFVTAKINIISSDEQKFNVYNTL